MQTRITDAAKGATFHYEVCLAYLLLTASEVLNSFKCGQIIGKETASNEFDFMLLMALLIDTEDLGGHSLHQQAT